jgi:anti-sigma factor RsiW
MECQDAKLLILPYLDDELSEATAAPLRQHLIECASCRAEAQADKALDAWFVPTGEVAVPADFAARVARRAVAGDRGGRYDDVHETVEGGGRILSFVLQATAVAAVLLFLVSVAVKVQDKPTEALQANSANLNELLDELDDENRRVEEARHEDGRERGKAE